MSAQETLRHMLDSPGLVCAPGVYDGISARLAIGCDFRCLYLTGAGVAMSLIGQPDIGLVGMDEMASQIRRITSFATIPLLADGDTGYGNHLNVIRCVREFERAGAAGIQLEDQDFPKRCGHLARKSVVPPEEFVLKLRAATMHREDPDFIIVARTDARAVLGLDDAIDRGNRYRDAGADVIFVEAPQTEEEIAEIAARVDAPLLFNVVAQGITPPIPIPTLEQLGFKIAIFPGAALVPGIDAISRSLCDLERTGTPEWAPESSPVELFNRFGLESWEAIDERLTAIDDGVTT